LLNKALGDVLVATPLLHGLRRSFPNAKIAIGVGDWAKPLLENNPDIDEIIPCNAPWHNKQICRYPANSPRTFLEGLCYSLFSKEARYLRKESFSHGIDVLGCRQGSWLLRSAGIPNRFGVKGYAGGDNWCKKCVSFDENRKVAEAALEFLKLLGSNEKIEPRPKIFLTENEVKEARRRWNGGDSKKKKIIIAPGGGFPEKCWGDENFNLLTNLLLDEDSLEISVIGSREDRVRIRVQECDRLKNWCGSLTLRESAAMVSQSDFVITNSSLCMHLAGAFEIPSLTLLGDWYDSANLHHLQWGYPESIIKGKELNASIHHICSVSEAYETIQKSIQKLDSSN
jgi:ADP-heptose:LPS heptosyltransferase